ncbi:MAG TPA: hypothetical protein VF765_23105 [Polyangiaceae bacterium]
MTKAVMLESPGFTPASDVNVKSSKVTPEALLICSAYPGALGATAVGVLMLYAHVVQSSPP